MEEVETETKEVKVAKAAKEVAKEEKAKMEGRMAKARKVIATMAKWGKEAVRKEVAKEEKAYPPWL